MSDGNSMEVSEGNDRSGENDMVGGPSAVAEIVQWVRKYVCFDHASGVTICTKCNISVAFRSFSTLRGHIREKHVFTGPIANECVNEILCGAGFLSGEDISAMTAEVGPKARIPILLPQKRLPKSLEGSFLTGEQKLYWCAPESLEKKSRSLPAIHLLPVETGLQCPVDGCLYCSKTKETMRAHFYKSHSAEGRSVAAIDNCASVYVQTMSRVGPKCKYFPVHLTMREPKTGSSSSNQGPHPGVRQTENLPTADPTAPLLEVQRLESGNELTELELGDISDFGGLEDFLALCANLHTVQKNQHDTAGNKICEAENETTQRCAPRVTFADPLVTTMDTGLHRHGTAQDSPASDEQNKKNNNSKNNNNNKSNSNSKACNGSDGSVGDAVWNSINHLNPAFKGFEARQIACGKKTFKPQATLGDDQLLGSSD